MTHETRRFNVASASALQYSLSWAELITISLTFILILSSHLHLSLSNGLFSIGLPIKIYKALLPYLFRLYILPILTFWFNYPDYIRWTVKARKFLIVKPSPFFLIPLGVRFINWENCYKSLAAQIITMLGWNRSVPPRI